MVPRAESAPLPPCPCTVSVREGSLGEMHICEGPAASCVPVRPCRVFLRSGSRTTGNATSLGTRTGLPVRVQNVANQLDRLGMESPFSGERSSSACPVEQAQNMNGAKQPQMLPTPEEEVAGELRHAMGA